MNLRHAMRAVGDFNDGVHEAFNVLTPLVSDSLQGVTSEVGLDSRLEVF